MNTNDATRANAEGLPVTTPIQLLYQEWEAKNRRANKGGFANDEITVLCDQLDADADKFLGQDSTTPLDWIAKVLAATEYLTTAVRDEWADSIREEAVAFVQGAQDVGPIFDPSRLNMVGLFSLYDALTTVHEVITALCCRPTFESREDRVLSSAGEMLDRLADFVAGALQDIRETACERSTETPEDRNRKFFFLAHGIIDGITDPAYSVAELTRSAATLAEVRP